MRAESEKYIRKALLLQVFINKDFQHKSIFIFSIIDSKKKRMASLKQIKKEREIFISTYF